MKHTPDHNSVYYSIEAIHSYNVDPHNFEIYLMGEEGLGDEHNNEPGVEFTMSGRFVRNMRILMNLNPKTPILVHMKTDGGDTTEGMAIYDCIKQYPAHVTILCYTHASSMSSIILQAADKRIMMPHSTFMFHGGNFGVNGTYKQTLTAVEFSLKHDLPQMLEIYTDSLTHSGKFSTWDRKKIQKMLVAEMDKREDVYLTAAETVEWGFADEIFAGNWGTLKP